METYMDIGTVVRTFDTCTVVGTFTHLYLYRFYV
jgi:hypothetical protein